LTKIAFFEKNDPKWLDKNYDYFHSEVMDHMRKYNTTKALAERVLRELSLIAK
jgi:hypothetical protein